MDLLFAIFFGAGAAGWFYSKFGRRVGYTNTKEITITTLVVFVLTTIVFFTILTTFIPDN